MILTVEIPKEFKKQLSARFDLRKVKNCQIRVACPLCQAYKKDCKACCFKYWNGANNCGGCVRWILGAFDFGSLYFCMSYNRIYWKKEYEEAAKSQIKFLRKKAKELIKWT